ncbi:MAG TPA: PEP-CTERM sorting domain-containing protein [Vicinamibacterales bacterium]|nr:PEP-CTERM sorting domain-containing protein [Vicinamibacterales bacterium]
MTAPRAVTFLMTMVLIVGLAASAIAASAPAITFDEATGVSGNNNNQTVGWQFDVLTPVWVTALGWFDQGANGLGTAHTVGIWAPNGTLLTSVLVPAGTVAPLDGQYRVADIPDILLPVGTGYIIGGENFSTSDDRLVANAVQVVDPRIHYVDATYSLIGSGFVQPTHVSIATTGFEGPMAVLVPEPATVLLLATGLVGVGARTLRSRRRP